MTMAAAYVGLGIRILNSEVFNITEETPTLFTTGRVSQVEHSRSIMISFLLQNMGIQIENMFPTIC